VPANLDKSFLGGICKAQYEYNEVNHELNLTFESNIEKRYVEPKDYPNFKEWIDSRASFCGEWIVLEKKSDEK
jgi:phage major head subunit gpT-like protein